MSYLITVWLLGPLSELLTKLGKILKLLIINNVKFMWVYYSVLPIMY